MINLYLNIIPIACLRCFNTTGQVIQRLLSLYKYSDIHRNSKKPCGYVEDNELT